MQSQSKRGLMILVFFLGMIFIGGLVVILTIHKNKKPASTEHIDPFSHQTVSSPAGKEPDKYGVPAGEPVYYGLDKLLAYGLSQNHISYFKAAFLKYSQSQSNSISQVSIDVDHISTSHDNTKSGAPFIVTFKVQLNEKDTKQVRLEYVGLEDLKLFLINPSDNSTTFEYTGAPMIQRTPS